MSPQPPVARVRGERSSASPPNLKAPSTLLSSTPQCSLVPARGSRDVRPHEMVERQFRTLPIGPKLLFIVFPIPASVASTAERPAGSESDFADPRRSYTKALNRSPWTFRIT